MAKGPSLYLWKIAQHVTDEDIRVWFDTIGVQVMVLCDLNLQVRFTCKL